MRKALLLLTTAALLGGSALNGAAIARDRDREFRVDIRVDKDSKVTANQIVDRYNARIARIKADLKLTPDQEKNWGGFEKTARDVGKVNADRVMAARDRAEKEKGPANVIDYMRLESEFLNNRAADQKKLADAADPFYGSLDERQKRLFATELMKLGRGDTN